MSGDAPVRLAEPGTMLLPQALEPLIVSVPRCLPPAPDDPWLIMIHAPGENRTGNNFWQAQAARRLAEKGFVVARFDLAGHGESLAEKNVRTWDQQIAEAVSTASAHGAAAVHLTARGLHAALLPTPGPGVRIAVHPPDPAELVWWHEGPRSRPTTWEALIDASPDEVAFWGACGVETNLLGGLSMPTAVLDQLIERIRTADAVDAWDLTLCTPERRTADPNRAIAGRHVLARLECERRGLESILYSALALWTLERAK